MPEQINIREAKRADVPAIVALFKDDILGSKREVCDESVPFSYYRAFDTIKDNKSNMMIVSEINGNIVGTLQIIYITNMSYQGARRAVIEGVHVDSSHRNCGIGKYMMQWAIAEAKAKGCRIVQLTSNKQRKDAHRFYERLGFKASHEGFKLDVTEDR